MSRRVQAAMLAVLAILAAAGIALRALLGGKPQPVRAVIVFDRSDSTRDACAAVTGVAEMLLAERSWPKGSSIVILATGDDKTLGEPVELFRHTDFRRKRTVEGKSTAARQSRALLASIYDACESAPRTRTSPIYLAVRRGAEMLSGAGCETERCTLAVVSDGEETVEPGLAAALKRGGRTKKPTGQPARIANETARVTWCGLAETVAAPQPASAKAKGRAKRATEPKRDAGRADRLLELWRGLFTEPSSVELAPVCPKRKAEA